MPSFQRSSQMDPVQPNESAGSYFALPRFIEKLRGRSGVRSEANWVEAYLSGSVIYLISYLFAATLLLARLHFWQTAIALPVLLFAMWIFWLIVLYANSLIVKACWACGLCTDLPRNRIQSVLMGILTTVFAAQLMASGSWLRWIGALWIIGVALNLAAALLLALFDEERS
jgi:hypothetical protein